MVRAHPSSAYRVACFLVVAWILIAAAAAYPSLSAAEKPKVRAVTAFVRLDRAQYRARVNEALTMLRKAKAAY
jgi:hypothetical protein